MDIPYDGRRHQGYPPRPGYATSYSNKHHEALEFNYAYRAATPDQKNKTNIIMTVLYLLSLSAVVMLVIAGMTLNPKTPIYFVNDVRVNNFSTKPILTGNWYANVTVYNPNSGRFGHFHDFMLDFIHNNEVIATATAPGFNVNKNKHHLIEVNASTNSANVMALVNPELQLDELKNEQDNSVVVVVLKIIPVTVLIPNIGSYMEGKGMAFCTGLRIKFQKDTLTEGRLDTEDGQPNFCKLIIPF